MRRRGYVGWPAPCVLVLTPEQLELALSAAVVAASIVSAAPLTERYVTL